MYQDEIIAEVWRNRDAYVQKHHHNLDDIIEDLRHRQARSLSELADRRQKQESVSGRREEQCD